MIALLALCSLGLAADAALPDIQATWRDGVLKLAVTPPPGEHIAAEAPVQARLLVGELTLRQESRGDLLARGLPFTLPASGEVSGELELGLCLDGATACRPVQVAFAGQITGKKGKATWTGAAPRSVAHREPSPVDQVFASAGDRVVLLDFGAIWCPPCNLMAAQVLDDPADAAALAPFAVAWIDVDRPESWVIKDRYHVGGYPTLVAARADGTEIDRLLGYPGEAQTLAWLAQLTEAKPVASYGPVDQAAPEVAVQVALRLAVDGRTEEAKTWWARVGPPSAAMLSAPDYHVARLLLDGDPAQVGWLSDNGVDWRRWLFESSALAETDATLRPTLRDVARGALFDATVAEQADLLWLIGSLEEADGSGKAPLLYSAAAVALASQLSGDPRIDRGHYSFLADLYVSSGQTQRAVDLLLSARTSFPNEFTWPYALANTLLEAGRAAEALPYAEEAVAVGYGDNRLRAVNVDAKVLAKLGRSADALALIDRTLAETPRPTEGLDVRTPRYLKTLETTRGEIAAGNPVN